MLSSMTDAVAEALRGRGLDAEKSYGTQYVDELTGVRVFVGIRSAESRAAGFGGYLGKRTREDGGEAEVYGLRCGVTLALDICAPAETEHCEEKCAERFDEAVAALGELGELAVTAVRLGRGEIVCGGEVYRLPGSVDCTALLAVREHDGAAFTDFILKGVLEK